MGRKSREAKSKGGKGRIDDSQPQQQDDRSDDNSENETNEPIDIDNTLDLLLEPDSQNRINALNDLTKVLKLNYRPDIVEQCMETLKIVFTKAFKKGSTAEILAILKNIEYIVVTLGAECDEFFAFASSPLKSLITDSKNVQVISDGLRVLSLLTFIGGPDESDTLELLPFLDTYTLHKNVDVVVNALRGWGLLVSILAPDVIIKQLFEKNLKTFVSLLENNSPIVQVAAANNIALLFDMWAEAAELDAREFNIHDCDIVDVGELIDQLYALAKKVSQTAKTNARQQREWRSDIRRAASRMEAVAGEREHDSDDDNNVVDDYQELKSSHGVQKDAQPSTTVKVQHETVLIEGVAMLLQLESIRTSLAGGFLVHMTYNPLLHEIFSFDVDLDKVLVSMTPLEKRMLMSPNSKASKDRTTARDKDRRNKNQRKRIVFDNHD